MYLVRLVYCSSVNRDNNFSEDDVKEILASARHHNGQHDVTGMLCFNRKFFLPVPSFTRFALNRFNTSQRKCFGHGMEVIKKSLFTLNGL